MTPEQFIQTREVDWRRLSLLLDQAGRSRTRLTPNEIEEAGKLYRTTTSDLAVAQRDFPRHQVSVYLNQLTARAHSTLYQNEPFALKQLLRFFTHIIPQTFRETWRFTFAAALLLYLPAIFLGVTAVINPVMGERLLPLGVQGIVPLIEEHEKWFEFAEDEYPSTATFITSNNIQVSIFAFAGGMTAGIQTIRVLFTNGLMLGGIVGLAIYHDFFALLHFIVGHGVIELSMICVAGGAGLMLAWAIIHPTPYSRSDAIAQAARKAVVLLITCALFLVVAGLIEGFISPRPDLAPIFKYIVGITSGAITFAYLMLSGREKEAIR